MRGKSLGRLLVRLLVLFQLVFLPQWALAAAYATEGSGTYRGDILWLTWGGGGPNGTHGVRLSNGANSSASLPVANGVNLDVTCSLANIRDLGQAGTPGGANLLKSYRPGDYPSGDRLDYLYRIGGVGKANQLVSGIVNSTGGSGVDFDVKCSAEIGGKPVDLRGFVIADAESMAVGEYIESEGEGDWYVIDVLKDGQNRPYEVLKTPGTGTKKKVRFSSGLGDGGRSLVSFLKFSTRSPTQEMSFSIKGNGATAIAIGLVVPYADFGDAPASYGDALHLIDDINFSSDGIANGTKANINTGIYQPAKFLAPASNYLGSKGPDSEPASQYSPNADGDDLNGADRAEEDGWPAQYKTLSVLQSGEQLAVPVACNGSGRVSAWIDFDINGKFDPAEKAEAQCSGGQAALRWTVPALSKEGKSYVRLRYSFGTQTLDAMGVAQDGEVEDHVIQVISPLLEIKKSSNAVNGVWDIGQVGAKYLLTVSNRGTVATGPSRVAQSIKIVDLMPAGIVPQWTGTLSSNGWSCTYVGQKVSCESGTGLFLAPSTDAGNSSSIELPVTVLPAAASQSSLINYASVGGGRDPYNAGNPPEPSAQCTQAFYCASTPVSVRRPGVEVAKSANPTVQAQVAVGQTIIYSLDVTVIGSKTLSPVVLTDTLDASLEFGAITANNGGFVLSGTGNTRLFTLPTGTAPGTYRVSYSAIVAASAVSQVFNRVRPTGGGSPDDPSQPVPACTKLCETSHSLETPLVTVAKQSNPARGASVAAEQTITYTLTTVVTRSQTLSPVVLSDMLGPDLSFGVVTANTGAYVLSGTGDNRSFTLPAGARPGSYSVSYSAMVKPGATGSGLLNKVQPTGGGDPKDPQPVPPACNPSCETDHVLSPAVVTMAKKTTGTSVRVGDTVVFDLEVKVSQAQTRAAVVLTDILGPGLDYVPGSVTGDLTFTSVSGNTLTLTLAPATPPGLYKVSYRALVNGQATGTVTNTITGTPSCAGSCTTSTPVVLSDVSYFKSTQATEAAFGDEIPFELHLEVRNSLTTDAVELVDTLGTGLELVAGSVQLPAGGWASAVSGQKLTVTAAPGLAVGSYTVRYKARVTAGAGTAVSNKIVATGGDNPSCASLCATETPVSKPVVTFSKTSASTGVKVGETIAYRVTVQVSKAVLTEEVTGVVDNLGLGLNFVEVVQSVGVSHSSSGKTLLLHLAKGTPPGTYFLQYLARVDDKAVSSVQNHVEGVPAPGGLTPVCNGPCMVVTPVIREIEAVDDPLADVKSSTGSSNAGNAYTNDRLNGAPAELSDIVGKVLNPATPIQGGSVPVLNVSTGLVTVAPGTPAGQYTIDYQICDRRDPALCDNARITIRVLASVIQAVDDSYVALYGQSTPQIVGNAYAENDTLDGLAFENQTIAGEVLTPAAPIGGKSQVPVLDVLTGQVSVPAGTPAGEFLITYRICDRLEPGNCDDAVIKVVINADTSLLRIVKSASVRNVKIGDLVRYTLQVENIGPVNVVNAHIVDTAAPGFTYVAGSLQGQGLGDALTASGVRPVQFGGITLAVGAKGTLVYLARVGAGVRPGAQTNRAQAFNSVEDVISNVATATVEMAEDPLLDQSLIFGTVFDDRDGDGWQDSAAASGLTAKGGFQAAAYVANSTTVDRGQGPEPVADASSPLLHGLQLGKLTGRQSEADPADKHMLVIRQTLSRLDFNDDFVLDSDQGVQVRMDAAGKTTLTQRGEAAAGRNAVDLQVLRRVLPDAHGHVVEYEIRNNGIDERGVPGVRIASVEGLLMETDQYGRFHLAGVHGGPWERGRHFILKLDTSTLPGGAGLTTSNPLLRRITPGLPVRFDFGVRMTPQFMQGKQEQVEIELGTVLFSAGQSQVRPEYRQVLQQVADKLLAYSGGELVIEARGETEAVAFARAAAVREAVLQALPAHLHKAVQVSVRGLVDDPQSLIAGVTEGGALLGTLLFDTDKSVVRSEFKPLLAQVAAHLVRLGGGVVYIVGHTDVRGTHAYNQALGLRRAQAVYDALMLQLPQEVRQRTKVEPGVDAGAAVGSNRPPSPDRALTGNAAGAADTPSK